MTFHEELFDVVDENDRVVAVNTRSEVHRQGLRHRAVHVFLFRSDGRMLIHKRSDTKEEFPSVWTSSASGHVSSEESYDTSASRELQEELGVSAELTFILKVDACADTSNEFTQLYVASTTAEVVPDPVEMSAVAWVTADELAERLQDPQTFSPAFRMLYRRYLDSAAQAD